MQTIGWIGGLALSFCGIPQAWQCYRQGNSNGLSNGFIILWAMGELFTFSYILYDSKTFPITSWPLIVNYTSNITMLAIMVRYKIWPRK